MQTIWITGASSGIGFASAKKFLENNWVVIISSSNIDKLNNAKDRMAKTTKVKNKVLDLFGGSGSTLIACEKTNRYCRMMELDPKYCDVIIKRWEDFTGQTAKLLERGTDTNSFKEEEKWQDQKNTKLTQTKSLN